MTIAVAHPAGVRMTWFIDPGRFPVIGHLTDYDGRLGAPAALSRTAPISEAEIKMMPKTFQFFARSPGFEYIVLDQKGYLLLSQQALAILSQLQTEGWNAIPLTPIGYDKRSSKAIASETYYLLDLFLRVDAFDLSKGNIQPITSNKGTPVERTDYKLNDKHRAIVIRRDTIGDLAIWRGVLHVFSQVIFVSDELRRRWCELGVPEELFEPCLEV